MFWRKVTFSLAISVCLASLAEAQTPDKRPLAPGVLKVIVPTIDDRDSHSVPMPLPELNANQFQGNYVPQAETLYGSTRDIVFFRDVWAYEFSFLPLRQLKVEVPVSKDRVETKTVWYLVYRIRNVGKNTSYEKIVDEKFRLTQHEIRHDQETIDPTTLPNRFYPVFTLDGWVEDQANRRYNRVNYVDSVLPYVVDAIQLEEDKGTNLLDSVEISRIEIPRARGKNDNGVWGVAVWEGVDPRIDYVSVKVEGVTNAFRILTSPDGSKSFKHRVLQLNFWRPGDRFRESNDRIIYGIPLVDNADEQIEICRRYELPGPIFRGYEVIKTVNFDRIFEADAAIDMRSFTSTLVPELDSGKIPESIIQAFTDAGVSIPVDTKAETVIPGMKWSIKASIGGVEKAYELRLEPQFWEKKGKGIRFIKTLDHLWIYR